MSKETLELCGQQRQFVADAMVKVSTGEMEVAVASVIGKLAAQNTESLYAELKARIVLNIGADQPLGSLPIGLGALKAPA